MVPPRTLTGLMCCAGAFAAAQLLDPSTTFSVVLALAALGVGWALATGRRAVQTGAQ